MYFGVEESNGDLTMYVHNAQFDISCLLFLKLVTDLNALIVAAAYLVSAT